MNSLYSLDLSNEQYLGKYLDEFVYPFLFKDKSINYRFERVSDLTLQRKGIDLFLHSTSKKHAIDEKAQLDYLNKSLPTFAFELSYLLHGKHHNGWLFDENKLTEYYFLITEIKVKEETLKSGITSLKITSIQRKKLIDFLNSIGLSSEKLAKYEQDIRNGNNQIKKIGIPELNEYTEGNIQISHFKSEKPINLVLKLDYLISNNIGKQIL